MNMVLPEDVRTIIQKLERCGHEAYAVGGCVRDCILGKEPADWDVTTSATPEQVKGIFDYTIDTGIAHGTVTVMLGKKGYEVTTYRIDGEYLDGRHPKEVTFTSRLSEDLRRRDFTINAMAYNDTAGLVDLFGGWEDIKTGQIRCVGDPRERFSEDALRMLRALRFMAQLDFTLEEQTRDAICCLAPSIAKVSQERITAELMKLLTSDHPQCMRQVYETGLSRYFLPEFDAMMETPQNSKHHCCSVGEHTIRALTEIAPEKHLRLTMLLHDVAKPATRTTDDAGQDHFYGHPALGARMTEEILRRMKLDLDTIQQVKRLVRFHDERPALTQRSVRKAAVAMGPECFPDIFAVKRADTLAQSEYHRQEKLRDIEEFQRIYRQIRMQQQCLQKKDLAVGGRDLLELGVPQGRQIGEILDHLFALVVETPEKNRRDVLLEEAKKVIP
jgi:tRNA nucleotidyltransferase (CCA-adding enzyme)